MTLAEIKEILGRHTLVGQRDTHEILEALLGHLEAQERAISELAERNYSHARTIGKLRTRLAVLESRVPPIPTFVNE